MTPVPVPHINHGIVAPEWRVSEQVGQTPLGNVVCLTNCIVVHRRIAVYSRSVSAIGRVSGLC